MGQFINNRNVFLIVLKAGKFKVKAPPDGVSDKSLVSQVIDIHHLTVSSHGAKGPGISLESLMGALIPFVRAPSSQR